MISGQGKLQRRSKQNSTRQGIGPIGRSDDVLTTLRQIIRAVDVQSRRLAKQTGLSAPQLVVLKAVRDLGEVTTKTVSQSVSLSQPTVTTILDRLEAKGLVDRYRSKTDRRVVHTRLTKKGTETVLAAPPLLQTRFIEDFEALPDQRQTEIVSALTDVAQMMGADAFDASPVLTVTPPQAAV